MNPIVVRTVLALALAAASAAARQTDTGLAPPPELTMLRMYDGSILWGHIIGHDATVLHFQRIDNGGKVYMPWTKLDPALSDELLEKYGYVDHSGDEVMIEADRLVLRNGAEIIGLIVNRTENELYVKDATTVAPVPMLQIQSAATRVQVPALDIYTREELYQQELAKHDLTRQDASIAPTLWELSIFCERIYDFVHAVEQLESIQQVAPGFKANEVQTALDRNRIKVQQQTQLDALRRVDNLRVRGKFDDALTAIESFVATYPDSPLVQDARKKKSQVEKSREQALRERVVESWHVLLASLMRAKARESGLTFEAAMGWLDEGLANELIEAVTKDIQKRVSASATPDLVRRYFKERSGGKYRRASYGQGTWLLGDAEARKGLVKDDPSVAKPTSETDNARKKLEDRIARYLSNQEMVKKVRQSADEEDEREKFWSDYASFSKSQWMLGYYVEHAGDYELRDPQFSNCPDCGGSGKREVLNAMGRANSGGTNQAPSGGQTILVDCPMCHAVGVFRRVSYR